MRQEDRLNMAQFGWAGGMLNMSFVAGRIKKEPGQPRVFRLQQTLSIAQSIPVITQHPLAKEFEDGCYVSTFARIKGKTRVGEDGKPQESAIILQALHNRFTNAQEVDPDVAQERLINALKSVAKTAEVDITIRSMNVETPEELKEFVDGDEDANPTDDDPDPYAITKKDKRLIHNGNHAKLAGIIGFMEYRDGGDDPSGSRVQLYVQQSKSLEQAILVRIYGKQANLVAANYRPGHAIYVNGSIQVDVKKIDEKLQIVPYLKTYSVESAQTPHIKTSPMPEWAKELYERGSSNDGFAQMIRFIKAEKKAA